MCLVLFGYKYHPDYKLIIAANRDEFYDRPTEPAHYWEDHPHVLAGRDLKGKGTWMGVTKQGRISLLTNYRDPSNIKENAPTRGKLVSDFLIDNNSPRSYLDKLKKIGNAYNGYNIVLGNPDDIWYFSNHENKIRRLGSGIYGLSNHLLNTPWPKVEKGGKMFKSLLNKKQVDPGELLDMLYNDTEAPDKDLPDTGVSLELERKLSAMFIKTGKYGSRNSTVLLVDKDNNFTFAERVYDLTTFDHETRYFRFKAVPSQEPVRS